MALLCMCLIGIMASAAQQRRFTVMGFGDSITEGGEGFSTYLYPLWQRLFAAGYDFDFIGPRKSECRIGGLACCGFSGKTAEWLDGVADSIYRLYPADFVLIHAGHNHHAAEKPVAGIIGSYRSVIGKLTAINPRVRILLATVTQSGKLPKYGYIPELNDSIRKLVAGMGDSRVVMVDMDAGHDWRTMTVADMVHPNRAGRERMGRVWYEAIRPMLGEPPWRFVVERRAYKRLPGGDSLTAHVFMPRGGGARPAVAWFFAGGWKYGSPLQFYRECAHYAGMGMVAVSFDYRTAYTHGATVADAVADSKDAVRWLRDNAAALGVDRRRIAVGGASAGGSMAALLGCVPPGSDDSLSRPDLLLLEYPTLGLSRGRLREGMPPMLLFMGTADEMTPADSARDYAGEVRRLGNECEYHPMEGRRHPIFRYRQPLTADYLTMLKTMDTFLENHHFFR